jgi:Fibronectin type III domain
MEAFLKIARTGLLGGAMLLKATPTVASLLVLPPPLVVTATVTASTSNLVNLEFTTNLYSPNWQTLGTFTGTTNVAFTNLPAVFLRGICSNRMASATLTWNPSSNPNVTGYKIYYGITSGAYSFCVDVGNNTKATISNLIPGVTYYFSAMAYTPSGSSSPLSNEVSGSFQPSFSLTISTP